MPHTNSNSQQADKSQMRFMKVNKTVRLVLIGIAAAASQATAQLRVVATTPDLASVAREVGGDRVNVVALAKPTEDPHFVDAKPSFIVTLNRAEALVQGGAQLEIGCVAARVGACAHG